MLHLKGVIVERRRALRTGVAITATALVALAGSVAADAGRSAAGASTAVRAVTLVVQDGESGSRATSRWACS